MAVLSDFSSVLEVSVGVHLAYSFFPDFHSYLKMEKDTIIRRVEGLKKVNEDDDYQSNVKAACEYLEVSRTGSNAITQLLITRIFTKISLLVAVISICLLIVAGFFPDCIIDNCLMSLIISAVLLPMPFMLLYSFFIEKKVLKEFKTISNNLYNYSYSKIPKKTWEELKEMDFFRERTS